MPNEQMVIYQHEPQHDYFTYGDGVEGGVVVEISQKFPDPSTGLMFRRIVFIPSRDLQQAYQISPYEKTPEGYLIRLYPECMIYPTSFNPKLGRRHLILCDYNCQDTVLTNLYGELLQKNMMLQKMVVALKQGLYYQQNENNILIAHPKQQWKNDKERFMDAKEFLGTNVIMKGRGLHGMEQQFYQGEQEQTY